MPYAENSAGAHILMRRHAQMNKRNITHEKKKINNKIYAISGGKLNGIILNQLYGVAAGWPAWCSHQMAYLAI